MYLIPNMAFTVYKRVIYLKLYERDKRLIYKLTKVFDIITYGINMGTFVAPASQKHRFDII